MTFSVVDVNSLNNIRNELLPAVREAGTKTAKLYLVGLKTDLRTDRSTSGCVYALHGMLCVAGRRTSVRVQTSGV